MKKKYVYAQLIIVLATVIFTSCSSKNTADIVQNKSSSAPMEYGTSDGTYEKEKYDMALESDMQENKLTDATETSEVPSSSYTIGTLQNVSTNRKLIKTVYLELQTLEFKNTLNFILDKVKTEGGYIENSNIQGNGIYEDDRKSAKLVIRIPSNVTDAFVNLIGENANVINRNEETKDITKEFVDTESHIKMLQIEQERLLSFLEKAENLKDMITLEDRLGEVRYELEGYSSTLKTYENLVEYSTITISLYEVNEMVVMIEKQSTLSRLKSGFSETVTDIGDGFTNFFVWLVVNLPYFVIWGIFITVGILIGIKANKKYKAKLYGGRNKSIENKLKDKSVDDSDDKAN
jgi:hypothetical protein